jgi:uncharacterized membrane protein (UPF0127 family)
MTLLNSTKNNLISEKLEYAVTFWARLKGLLGRNSLADGEAMLIEDCNGIHTCFMRFPIDVVFLDAALTVRSIQSGVKPWRFVWGDSLTRKTLELNTGFAEKCRIDVGDKLNVAN